MDWINTMMFKLLDKGPQPLLGTGSRAARAKITVSCVPCRRRLHNEELNDLYSSPYIV